MAECHKLDKLAGKDVQYGRANWQERMCPTMHGVGWLCDAKL